ncbi:MAG: HAD-IA family hydrolase [Candidatus Baltobacteraceae bacterium]
MQGRYRAVLFDLFGTLVNERGEAIAGASKLLRELPVDRWAIVTSCGRSLASALISGAGFPTPSCVVTADDVARGKPAPDGYLLAAQRLRIPAADCIVVEDSEQGIAAGISAGMNVIAISRSHQHRNVRYVEHLGDITFEVGADGGVMVG